MVYGYCNIVHADVNVRHGYEYRYEYDERYIILWCMDLGMVYGVYVGLLASCV